MTERRSVGDAPPSSLRQGAGMAAIATRARRTNLVRVLELIAVLDRSAEQALPPADWAAAERTAHQLAGSAGIFGFDGVSTLARALEPFLVEARTTGVLDPGRRVRFRQQLRRAEDELAAGQERG